MVSFIDIIFLMILVVVIITRLYNVLGSKADTKNVRVILKPLDENVEKRIVENISKVINENKQPSINNGNLTEADKLSTTMPDFNKDYFIKGARRVFELVLQSFGSGNLLSIKELVSKKVFDAFSDVLSFRKENNITSEIDFICFDKSEIKDIKFLKNSVKIVVEFVSEQVNLLKNADGEIIEGDENFVQKITDVWTFERYLNAKNNNWVLVSTKKTV